MSDNNFWASYHVGRRRALSESSHLERENDRLKKELVEGQAKAEGRTPSNERSALRPLPPVLKTKHNGAHRAAQKNQEADAASSPMANVSSPDFHPVVAETRKHCDPRRLGIYGFMYVGYKGGCIRMRVGPTASSLALTRLQR